MSLVIRKVGFALIILLTLSIILPLASAQDDYPVVVIDFREIRFAPEEKTSLQNAYIPFRTDTTLLSLLEGNNTLFWEHLGGYDFNLNENTSLKSFALVTVNESGFYQTIVALDASTENLEWIHRLNETYSANFEVAIRTATDFFADDGHYWGICESAMIVPGSSVALSQAAVWNFQFYLVGETERWTLQIDIDGNLITYQFQDVPCQDCIDYTPLVIVGIAAVPVLAVLIARALKNRNR